MPDLTTPEAAALPRPRPERAEHRGAWVTLEPLATGHAGALWPLAEAAPGSWAWLPHGPFPTAAAFRGYLRFAAMSGEELLWAVRPHGADGEPGPAAGWLGLLDIRPAHAAIELGNIWFPPGLARCAGLGCGGNWLLYGTLGAFTSPYLGRHQYLNRAPGVPALSMLDLSPRPRT